MRIKTSLIVLLGAALMCSITSCVKKEEEPSIKARYFSLEQQNSSAVINTDDITSEACFFNYDADGVTVQLVAIRDSDGGVHAAFNTCQSCSPSPKAYYRQMGQVLQCANCGFTFAPVQVGVKAGGCNPWPIEGIEIGEKEITIPVSSIENMRTLFASWQGPTE